MPKGGHAMSGPPPDPNALRRDRKSDGDWVTLPAEGRAGDPPAWPLSPATDRETHFWTAMWARPQAVMWERLGQEIEVALYVRRLTEAEQPGVPTALATLVRQMADSLGLTIPGLRMHRWKLAVNQVEQKRQAKAAVAEAAAPAPLARDRFRVVNGSAG